MEETIKEKLNKTAKKYMAMILMGLISMASVFSVGAFSRRVHVKVDNTERTSLTVSNDTDKILNQMDIKVFEGDAVKRQDDQDIRISVIRSCNVSVSKGKEKVFFTKAVETVEEAIKESGFSLGKNDEVNYPLNEKIFSGMNIEISEMKKISVFSDGQKKEGFVPENLSVDEALKRLDINVSSNDLVNVDLSSKVYAGMEVTINRVEIREVVKKEEIPFKTIYKTTHLLDGKGQQVSSAGKKGEKEVVVKETVVDGVVQKSEEISSKVITQPVDEVVLKGTDASDEKKVLKEAVASASSSKGSESSNVFTGSATAYTAPSGARTSQGYVPTAGVTIAVNPKKIPYGSRLVITDLNDRVICKGIAQDTGGALRSGSALVDIFMKTKAECIRFGRRQVKVKIV